MLETGDSFNNWVGLAGLTMIRCSNRFGLPIRSYMQLNRQDSDETIENRLFWQIRPV